MTTIGLVRHGVTDWNKTGRIQGQTDIALNSEGIRQAEQLAERLRDEKWDIIYSSDLKRALQTAEIMNSDLGLRIVTDARLREVNFGQIEGTTLEERIARWGHDWRSQDLGKEKQEAIDARISAAFRDILAEHANGRILIVSHGALIVNCLRLFVPELDTTERLDNATITLLTYDDERWDCPLYNCKVHLQ